MSRRLVMALWLAVLVLASCSQGSGAAPGLKDAGPLIASFGEAGKALDGLGAAMTKITAYDNDIPVGFRDKLKELGSAARKVLDRAEPDGPAGVAAIQKQVAAVATDVIQHLVATTGGLKDSQNIIVAAPPEPVAFRINVPALPLTNDRSAQGKIQAHSRLGADLRLEIEHFIYAAVLANPAARAKLTPRLSPEDLPKTVDPELNLNADTTEEWRQQLFDNAGRLVVPSPFDPTRWKAFLAWTEAVNPTILDPVSRLKKPALDGLLV